MGAMFIGQLFLQNVLGYDSVEAGAAILPAAAGMVVAAPLSAMLVEAHGSRATLLTGYAFCLTGFATMLLLWREGIGYGPVAVGYAFVGVGVGLAGTPASRSLTGSVPVTHAGMASATADLQRDLGGAVMQSILGALLAAGYADAFSRAIDAAPQGAQIAANVQQELTRSFAERGDDRRAVPGLRPADHSHGPVVVPRRRPLGVPGGPGRHRPRRIAGRDVLPSP